jgi:hypothetical protein
MPNPPGEIGDRKARVWSGTAARSFIKVSDHQHDGMTDSPMSDVSFVRRSDVDSLIQALRGLDVPDAEIENLDQAMNEAASGDARGRMNEWLENLSGLVRSGSLPAASVATETDPEGWLTHVREALRWFEAN